MIFRTLLIAMLLCGGACKARAAESNTKARLVFDAEATRPGGKVMAAVCLEMAAGWHTYWRNGGDAGAPTEIKWELPKGITAKDIMWPLPEKSELEGVFSYGYHDVVYLLVPLEVDAQQAAGVYEIKAKVNWLECEKTCLPGEQSVAASFKVGPETVNSPDKAAIDEWLKKIPQKTDSLALKARWGGSAAEGRELVIEWQKVSGMQSADFYPFSGEGYDVTGKTEVEKKGSDTVIIKKTVTKNKDPWPKAIKGVVVGQPAGGAPVAHEVELRMDGDKEGAKVDGKPQAGGTVVPSPEASREPLTAGLLLIKLAAAFIGGLILNIMPCVLPVIALKILGFVNQSKDEPARVRKMGWVYALGILVSFLVLAGVVIGVRSAGQAASWGMQYQNTQFVILMTVLVMLVALNLFGIFEVTLGGSALSGAGALASREGLSGTFFNGVLATALATPCTAPFLGAALGFAFTQSAMVVVLVFLTVGLGLASPYVVLSYKPAWLRFLPKPGTWMEQFKKAMGFPMLATAVWLYTQSVEGLQQGSDLWLGLFLVMVALAAWIWGEFRQREGRKWGPSVICLLVLLIAYAYVLEGKVKWRSSMVAVASAAGAKMGHPDGIEWRSWSPAAVAQAQAEGRPILVDFTASWCLTCQVNAKTSIEIPEVKNKLKEINAVALLENSRVKNAQVVAELNRHGRAGVPLVLVYSKDSSKKPEVLPEVLTPKIVLDALERASK